MEAFASFWNYARLLGAIILIFVVALVVVQIVRSRRAATESPAPTASRPMEIEADLVDSSHIGFAPLVGSVSLPSREERGENNA
jgi:hypothetical protein